MRTVPFLVLALLLGAGAVMLVRAPARRYVVACERTSQVACVLEQSRAAGTERWQVPLGPHDSAVVRVLPQRRGSERILLYLQSPTRAVFAAEFEGADAAATAATAAARLNAVLRGAAPLARIEVVPPPLFRQLAWGALGVMGLLIVAGYREVRRRPPRADEALQLT
jgi:hypothetical protein